MSRGLQQSNYTQSAQCNVDRPPTTQHSELESVRRLKRPVWVLLLARESEA